MHFALCLLPNSWLSTSQNTTTTLATQLHSPIFLFVPRRRVKGSRARLGVIPRRRPNGSGHLGAIRPKQDAKRLLTVGRAMPRRGELMKKRIAPTGLHHNHSSTFGRVGLPVGGRSGGGVDGGRKLVQRTCPEGAEEAAYTGRSARRTGALERRGSS